MMMRVKSIIRATFFSVILLFIFFSCKKGEFINTEKYMKLSIDAFYTDTVLFSSVSINDSVVIQNSSMVAGAYTKLLDKELNAPAGDSARIKFLIIKKHGSNIAIDSIIHFTNNNDFLLLQLDPLAKPLIINKKIESSTLVKPGVDSTKVRFFFNSADKIPADSVDLQLYKTEKITDGEYKSPVKHIRINGVRKNILGKYLSIYNKNPDIKYGFELYDAKNKNKLIQDYEWNSEDGFLKGALDIDGEGVFRTIQLKQSTREGEYSFTLATGLNAEYIFGLN
jgi:hypothetical protein